MKKDFYRNAKAYDIAFTDREFDTECDFLEWCLKKYGRLSKKNKNKFRFLELGCGPARHAREFAKRDWDSYALDISEEMVEFANLEAEKEKLKINAFVGDMVNYKLPKKAAITATLMESISHVTTNDDIVKHFRSVAKNLLPGGIYVIEATHPQFFFPDPEPNTWVSKEGSTEVEVTFGVPSDEYNSISQTWETTTSIKIREKGKEEITSESKSTVRWYLLQEMKLLIEKAGVFDKAWFFGSLYYTPPQVIDETEDSDAMVIVLRKKKKNSKALSFNI